MGVPGSSTGDTFHAWAQLPIPREQFALEQREQQRLRFSECAPLPGATKLLSDLKHAKGVKIALASSSENSNYDLKAVRAETKKLLGMFEGDTRILGDDSRVDEGRGKPAPDIYLVALGAMNASLGRGATEIRPDECLVFEDSVPGVEAGRRAGMRVIWVPHQGLAGEYQGKEKEVLAGRIGLVPIGDEEQLGEVDDGWGLQLHSLEDFPCEKFGIVIDPKNTGGV